MAPPPALQLASSPAVHPVVREVTEDTPPDLLEGTMDLLVVLPSTKSVRMTVNRRTPMMDLLIQVATINKINPGDHIVQVRNERGIELPYKPSTPIGALDTTTIEIVPKNRVNEYIIVKKPAKLANQPFEQTFRLQVHLPRNQLYVMRVSPRTVLEDILKEVCQEKNLDIQKYEIRHPANLSEKLPLTNSLSDFGLTEVTVVSKNTKINSSVSAADIMAMQQTEEGRTNKYMDSSFKHSRSSVGDSSVSSGSTGSARGVSPSRSDDSRSISPLPNSHAKSKLNHRTSTLSSCSSTVVSSVQKSLSMSNMNSPTGKTESLPPGLKAPPRTKKRAAPLPPMLLVKSQTESTLSASSISTAEQINSQAPAKPTPRKKAAPRLPPKASSVDSPAAHTELLPNHSRHSSGSSGYHESSILSDHHETHRFDRQLSVPAMFSKQGAARSTSNLTTVSSVSSTFLASSTGGSKKRRAPPPPAVVPFKPQSEIEEEDSETSSASHGVNSSKSDRSRQSSLEVEVEVHHTPTSRRSPEDHSSSTPISVKDTEILSSSPSSSLSSPGSSSGSTSSSPLPSTESPSSKPLTNKNKGSQSSSTKVPSNSSSSNYYPPVDEPCSSFSSVEDHGRSSPASAGTAQAAAPLPPPRTKTRENLLIGESDEPKAQPVPQPRPKPRPRPDRVSVDNLISENKGIIKPKPEEEPSQPEPAPASSSQLRNPLAKYGVKVLPDNVVKERADRLAKKASEELIESGDLDTHKLQKKPVAPIPLNASREDPRKSGGTPTPPQPEYRKKESDSSTTSSTKSKPAPPLPKSDIPGKESVRSIKSLNEKLPFETPKPQKGRSSTELSTEYDSDDLEENLSFFEPVPVLRKTSSDSRLVDKHNAKKLSPPSTNTPFDQQKSSILSQGSKEIKEQPVPKPKDNSARVSASVSGLEDLEKETNDSSSSEGGLEFRSGGLNRTHSDRLKSKSGLKSLGNKSSDGNQLNRWQNFESLNEIDDQARKTPSNSKVTKTSTNQIPSKTTSLSNASNSTKNLLFTKKSGRPSSEDFHEDAHILTAHVDHDEDGINSSESEVSYTDSGIPTTEPVTPSPMDFDSRISEHEDDGRKSRENYANEKVLRSGSGGSSPRSSFHSSDEGEQWRNVMETKALQTHETRERTFASMMPDLVSTDETQNKGKSEFLNNVSKDDDKDNSIQSSDSGADDGHISTSEGELLDDEPKTNKSSDVVPIRKLSKSESFSHNSEFDTIEMRRKKFSSGHGGKPVNNKRGNSTVDLRSSANHSSSEEDIRSTISQERNQKNHPLGTSTEKGHRATSMHNLMSNYSGHATKRQQKVMNDDQADGYITVQKATSLMEIQKLESDDNSNNPDIMKQFHSQLEAQFEQWKQDFLTKHLTEGQIPEAKSDLKVGNNESISGHIDTTDSTTLSLEKPSVTLESQTQSEDTTDYNHRTGRETGLKTSSVSPNNQVQNQSHSRSNEDDEPRDSPQTIQIANISPAAISQTRPSELAVSEKEPIQETEMISQNRLTKPTTQPAYRYSGPPTINMSSWSDRKRTTTVTVKKDEDYIMGFGQLDSKSAAAEPKSFISSKGPTTPYRGTYSSPEQPPVPVSTVKSTPTLIINKSSSPVTSSPNRGLSAALNVRPVTSENVDATGNVRSVLHSWKQRVEQNEKDKNINQGPPPEIDIYGSDPLPLKRSEPEIAKSEKVDFNPKAVEVIEIKTNDLPRIVDVKTSDPPNPDTHQINVINQDEIKAKESLIKQRSKPVIVDIQKSNNMNTKSVKPMQFKISTMDSKPITRVQSFHETKEVDIVDVSEHQKPSSSPETQNGLSLQERKNFFQGVKPVLNGKEVPVPAVNMKSSIATVQKVFDNRQQPNGNQSVVQRSMTLPTQPTKEPKPTIIQPEASSTIPRNVQVMSSNEMVQRVLGRPSGFETFRRSPSPVSSTTSTLSRTSSSGRGTPPSIASTDIPDNVVRISNEYKKAAPSPPSTMQNADNKSTIIINGSEKEMNDSEKIPVNSVSNNIFKQKIGLNISNANLKPSPSLPLASRFNNNRTSESTKIIVNGSPAPAPHLSQTTIEIRDKPTVPKPVVVEQTIKESRKTSSTTSPEVASVIQKRESVDAIKLKPVTVSSNGAPPPPPPPSMEGMNIRPTGLNLHGKLKPTTSLKSQPSTPASPSSPDPRAEICNMIKNSNGNFGLKKTGSTFLLK